MVQRLLQLTSPGPITAHWVAYQWNLPWTWEWAFPALRDTMGMKRPQSMVTYMAMKGPCWLGVGTCQLPLQRLHHDHCKLLTFNTPWKELRMEIRNKALSALGKAQKNWPSRQSDVFRLRFCEPKFLHLLALEKRWRHEPRSGPASPVAPEQLFHFFSSLSHVPLTCLLSLFLLEYNKSPSGSTTRISSDQPEDNAETNHLIFPWTLISLHKCTLTEKQAKGTQSPMTPCTGWRSQSSHRSSSPETGFPNA